MRRMHFILTDPGNMFIRTKSKGEEIYFFMSPEGKHLDMKREFHTQEFYEKIKGLCLKKQKEEVLPEKFAKLATKIVEKYEGAMKKHLVQKPAGNTLADALNRSGIRQQA